MAWMKVTKDGLESNIVKFFSDKIQQELIKKVGLDLVIANGLR